MHKYSNNFVENSITLLIFICFTGFTTAQTVSLLDIKANYSGTATFRCSITPADANVSTVTWVKILVGSTNAPVFSSSSGPLGAYVGRVNGIDTSQGLFELELSNSSIADEGIYSCTMFVDFVPYSDTGTLSIEKFPVLETSPPSLDELTDERTQQFNCSSGPAYPAVSLAWNCANTNCSVSQQTSKNSTVIPQAVETTIVVSCTLYQSTVCTCEASSGQSKNVIVTFDTAYPNITSRLDNQTLPAGLSYTFRCETEGPSTPDIRWIKEDTGETVSNSSFLNITNAALSDSGWYICNASSPNGMFDFRKMYLYIIDETTTPVTSEAGGTTAGIITEFSKIYTNITTTSGLLYHSTIGDSTTHQLTVPLVLIDDVTVAMIVVVVICFVVNCFLCILLYIKFPDEFITGAAGWFCVLLVGCCVIAGDVCGGVAWIRMDPYQQVGIIVMAIVLVDVGFFILGIVGGIVKGSNLKKLGSDETLTVLLRKLVHVVWSVATFGGVTVGIAIVYKLKGRGSINKTANGGRRHRSNNVTPEVLEPPRRQTSANSKDSEASQSKVPLHEDKDCFEKEKETVPLENVRKKKKKKKKKSEQDCGNSVVKKVQVATPRKLPPLTM